MIKFLCLLLALLLSGCTFREPKAPVASLTGPTGTASRAESAVTLRCGLPAYAPDMGELRAACAFAGGVLLQGEDGTLTALDGRLAVTGILTGGAYQLLEQGVVCFLPESRELVTYDHTLTETGRIVLPQELVGTPQLSQNGRRVWYCTENAIRVWDLDSGIRRRVKELYYDGQSLDALLMEDTVLACRITEGNAVHILLLDAEDGRQLSRLPGNAQITSLGQSFYAALPQSTRTDYVFGQAEGQPQMLLPKSLDSACTFLPALHAAVTQPEKNSLEYYDLNTGRMLHELTLPGIGEIKNVFPFGEDSLMLLVRDEEFDCDLLLTWKLPKAQTDTTVYTGPYYTQDAPDTAAMAGCQNYADQIGSKYGIRIHVWENATALEPWDYEFQPEYLERVLIQELKALDSRLARYPQEVLEKTASHFGGLNLCLVRQITGTAASGSLATATGIQFLEDGQAYVVLALGPYVEQALYHELFHVMETCVFSRSKAFDHWEDLNPAGFTYDYDYSANASRDSGVYLENSHRAFIDTYSMSYPKEDRARVLEYAMLPDCGYLFETDIMQKKLKTICTGLREAYDLEAGPYPWEQYLD